MPTKQGSSPKTKRAASRKRRGEQPGDKKVDRGGKKGSAKATTSSAARNSGLQGAQRKDNHGSSSWSVIAAGAVSPQVFTKRTNVHASAAHFPGKVPTVNPTVDPVRQQANLTKMAAVAKASVAKPVSEPAKTVEPTIPAASEHAHKSNRPASVATSTAADRREQQKAAACKMLNLTPGTYDHTVTQLFLSEWTKAIPVKKDGKVVGRTSLALKAIRAQSLTGDKTHDARLNDILGRIAKAMCAAGTANQPGK